MNLLLLRLDFMEIFKARDCLLVKTLCTATLNRKESPEKPVCSRRLQLSLKGASSKTLMKRFSACSVSFLGDMGFFGRRALRNGGEMLLKI